MFILNRFSLPIGFQKGAGLVQLSVHIENLWVKPAPTDWLLPLFYLLRKFLPFGHFPIPIILKQVHYYSIQERSHTLKLE
ncbi:MAG: hypothetical protein RIG66_24115 [Coleofasciculus sp. E2-BRE-01]